MTVQLVGHEELLPPLHSPVPAPSDFHLFGPLKQHLGHCQFHSNEELEVVVANARDRFLLQQDFCACSKMVQICHQCAQGLC
jgi:hypothetical protein